MLNEQDLNRDIGMSIDNKKEKFNKVKRMFDLQNKLNDLIKQAWFMDLEMDFQRASMVELSELMDHYGYKWWKKQVPDMDQSKLEVIDVAHFLISDLMQADLRLGRPAHYSAEKFLVELEFGEVKEFTKTPEGVRRLVDRCVLAAAKKELSALELGQLMVAFDLSFEELFTKYVEKNTLNIFRNENGYNEGTYKKIWNGKEDNEALMELAETIEEKDSSYGQKLHQGLKEVYSKVV